ncbi:hypothetical protein [Rheinheimera maricola]|uniref:KfrA N-terminal DNA-binding domain-containing protein n=1 Tax=Rheinheimera maricola TaxID=2793282 RepID=A0ABS7XBC7_9GAMM|nr:hypothetical protein [Rheinheimera maricola]MBZ9612858.1 hypothetical protein [Rheinheimera maricola]
MTDAVQLLQQVAAVLQQEGKSPSLALFRARLAGRLPPQQLFAAYQQWRNNPLVADIGSVSESTAAKASLPEPDQQLAQTLARIEAKLDLLLSKLER